MVNCITELLCDCLLLLYLHCCGFDIILEFFSNLCPNGLFLNGLLGEAVIFVPSQHNHFLYYLQSPLRFFGSSSCTIIFLYSMQERYWTRETHICIMIGSSNLAESTHSPVTVYIEVFFLNFLTE